MNLFFVKKEPDLKRPEIIGVIGENSTIIPIMPRVGLAMAESGFSNVNLPIDFLDTQSRDQIFYKAIDLSKCWYESVREDLFYQGADIGDWCRLQMLGFFQDVITADAVLDVLLEKFQPNQAVFFSTPVTPSFDSNMLNGRSDVFEAVAQWRFKLAGIDVVIAQENSLLLSEDRTFEAPVFVDEPPYDPDRIFYPDIPKDTPLVLGFAGGYDLFIIWPYLKALGQQLKAVPLLLSYSHTIPRKADRSGLSYREKMPFVFVGDIPINDQMPVQLQQAREKIFNGFEKGNSLPKVLRNPLLKFQFETLFDTLLPGAIKMFFRGNHIFKKFDVKLFIDDYCAGQTNRAWTQSAKINKVKSATIPHGLGVNLVEFFDFTSDYALAWGELSKRNLELSSPDKKNKILIAGNPFMDNISNADSFKETKNKSILLVTGGFLHQVWTDFDLNKYIDIWKQLLEYIKNKSDIEFIIKPHPGDRDFGSWYRDKAADLNNVTVVEDKKIEDILDGVFLSVLVGKPGTAAYVSMHCGVPVIYLDSFLARNTIGYDVWKEMLPVLDSVNKLAEFIDKIMLDEDYSSRFINQNISIANNLAQEFDAKRVTQILR